jgi:SAM-dependent methyltransferase
VSAQPTTQDDEAQRRRIAALEDEQAERIATAHAALAAAQDRYYWLDRWGVDLNALMRRRGAVQVRLALRALRALLRTAIGLKRRTQKLPQHWRRAYTRAELDVEEQPSPVGAAYDGGFARAVPAERLNASPVTDLLYKRLSEADVAEVERRAGAALPRDGDAAERRRLTLSLGVHHGVPGVLDRTGLTAAMPPDEVHAVDRGPEEAGGSPYYADLIADGFATAGAPIEPGLRCLDFGSSSGRAVRVLAAAYGDCEWHACDPIAGAIDWARDNISGVEFVHSPEVPPLPYDDGAFDRVYAISIWSHFSARAAVAWLEEMHRVIRPGGALLLTTHGFQTVAHDHRTHRRTEDQLRAVRGGLYDAGHWFWEEFGPGGDHGVDNPDWGTAFLTPEWLLARAAPGWSVGAFAPGRVLDNQDIYVLHRR